MTIDVTPVNDAATGAPTISGTAYVGETLTASAAGITDVDGVPNSFTYQWKRYAANGTTFEANIGADARTYTLTEADFSKRIKVRVDFIDRQGSSESRTSAPYPANGTVQRMTVQFQESAYSVAEGDMVVVTVALNVAAQHVIDIPIAKEELGGAGSTDYSGVPPSVTFNAGDASKTITFTATQDADDDDGESVLLAFATSLPAGVSASGTVETTVTITDDDVPAVTVSFGAGAYTVPEGGTQALTVRLSADPERTVVIPLTATDQGSASSTDYSVPLSVTFNDGELSKTITFTAATDMDDDDGESVLLAFATSLPAGVSASGTVETTVSIIDDDDPPVTVSFGADAYTVPGGRHGHSDGQAEHGPRAHGGHSPHGDGPGQRIRDGLLRAVERDVQHGRNIEDDHLHGGGRRGRRRRRERAARLRDEPAVPGGPGRHQPDNRQHHRQLQGRRHLVRHRDV